MSSNIVLVNGQIGQQSIACHAFLHPRGNQAAYFPLIVIYVLPGDRNTHHTTKNLHNTFLPRHAALYVVESTDTFTKGTIVSVLST